MEPQPSPTPNYLNVGKTYELIDAERAQNDPYYWAFESQPKVKPDVHDLKEWQIRKEFHDIIYHIANTRSISSEEVEVVQQMINGELIDETHVKWNLTFANEVYEHEFLRDDANDIETLDKHSVQQWVFDSAMNLAINRLSADDLREFGLTEEQIEGTTTIQKTSLPDVLLMANAWDNTNRDPALLFMLEKMIDKLEAEDEREHNNLFLDMAIATGKRFRDEDQSLFVTGYLDSAYGVQNGRVSMLVDAEA